MNTPITDMLDSIDEDLALLAAAKRGVLPLPEDVLVAWLRIANGAAPAAADLVALLARTPPHLLIGVAVGLQMAKSASPGLNPTLAVIQAHAAAAPMV